MSVGLMGRDGVGEGREGALDQCTDLYLQGNRIGDAGTEDLSNAVGRGALPNRKNLLLASYEAGPPGHEARRRGINSSTSKTLTATPATTTVCRWPVAASHVSVEDSDPELGA